MTARLSLGIDPGVSGGIAALTAAGDVAYLAEHGYIREHPALHRRASA